MAITLNIPESLSEITLGQYQQWVKITEGQEINNFYQQKMIEIFCGADLKDALKMRVKDINELTLELNKLFETKPKFIDRCTINDNEFGFIPKLDDMSFGEYIDLDTYLAEWDTMDLAMGVLFRPVIFSRKGKYLIEDYETASKYNMKNMRLDVVMGALVFFLEFKERIIETYSELFTESTRREIATASDSFNQKWGWFQSIYGLSNGDIRNFEEVTKLKLHQCLYMLSFEKDKMELESQMLNRNAKS